MERRDLFASRGMEVTVLSAVWKTLPNVTYANKMAFVNAQHKMYVCVNIHIHTSIYVFAHVCVCARTRVRVCACLCVLRMLGKWWIITA